MSDSLIVMMINTDSNRTRRFHKYMFLDKYVPRVHTRHRPPIISQVIRGINVYKENGNSIHEEIKGRLKSWNARYHMVQNLFSSCLLSKNIKIKV